MKRLVSNMLIISILCLGISGCGTWNCPEPDIQFDAVQKYVECPAPPVPVYGEFNNELHAGHLGNLEMMKENLESSLRYNDSLENTLDCYKKQAEGTNVEN